MGFKEKMMDGMMNKMSSEEKKEMMDQMMDKFFSDMSKEEKQEMMQNMMPKMMGGDSSMNMMDMMGGGNSPMNMMSMMMGGGKNSEGNEEKPWDMCKKMMSSMNENTNNTRFATPEIRDLFEEWALQIEEEILGLVETNGNVDPDNIAKSLKLSKSSVIYFLTKLAKKEKIKFTL